VQLHSYNANDTTTFPNSSSGATTIYLTADTSGQSSTDTLSIYKEDDTLKIISPNVGTDAVNKLRVSRPSSSID
jgi:hypothetical protein